MRNCENNFGSPSTVPSSSSCNSYNIFRRCVINVVKTACSPQDLQLMASYLVDKANELAWSCITDYNPSRIDDLQGASNNVYSQYGNTNYGSGYPYGSDRYRPNQYGGQYGGQYGSGQYGSGQYGSQYGGSQYGGSQYGGGPPYGQGNVYGGQYGSQYDIGDNLI